MCSDYVLITTSHSSPAIHVLIFTPPNNLRLSNTVKVWQRHRIWNQEYPIYLRTTPVVLAIDDQGFYILPKTKTQDKITTQFYVNNSYNPTHFMQNCDFWKASMAGKMDTHYINGSRHVGCVTPFASEWVLIFNNHLQYLLYKSWQL